MANKKKSKSRGKGSPASTTPASASLAQLSLDDAIAVTYDTKEAATLPEEEQKFIRMVSLQCPVEDARGKNDRRGGGKRGKSPQWEERLVSRAVDILEKYHMCIIHNVLTKGEIADMYKEYEALLDFSGDSAVGEKDATKRSGTRFYNCHCQVVVDIPRLPWAAIFAIRHYQP